MKKPKKPKPVRRNSFERALETAKSRLERANGEYSVCMNRVQELAIEIPKLEDMVRSLGGYVEKSMAVIATEALREVLPPPKPSSPLPRSPQGIVPEHLQKYIRPHPSTMKVNMAQGFAAPIQVPSDDEDKFLVDNIGGLELLP